MLRRLQHQSRSSSAAASVAIPTRTRHLLMARQPMLYQVCVFIFNPTLVSDEKLGPAGSHYLYKVPARMTSGKMATRTVSETPDNFWLNTRILSVRNPLHWSPTSELGNINIRHPGEPNRKQRKSVLVLVGGAKVVKHRLSSQLYSCHYKFGCKIIPELWSLGTSNDRVTCVLYNISGILKTCDTLTNISGRWKCDVINVA